MNEAGAKATRVLVVGTDGLIGRGLAEGLSAAGLQVFRTTRRVPDRSDAIRLDLADPSLDSVALPDVDTAFICASMNGFANCRADPASAFRVNVEGTGKLARRLVDRGCRVVSLSSSAVFDFQQPHRHASDAVGPRTVYGESKAASEKAILALGDAASVVRLTKVLTPSTARFSDWIAALKHGTKVSAFADLHFCPISLDFVVRALTDIMADKGNGVYQLSGAEDLSYAQAIRYLARRMHVDEGLVITDHAAAHGIPHEEIASFTSLDMSRYTALSGEASPQPFAVLDHVFGASIEQLVA